MKPDPKYYVLVRRSSVLNPLLSLVAITMPAAGIAVYLFQDDGALLSLFLCVAASPIGVSSAAFLYFLINDPMRLRSWEAD